MKPFSREATAAMAVPPDFSYIVLSKEDRKVLLDTRKLLEELLETLDVMSNPEELKALEESEKEIREGKLRRASGECLNSTALSHKKATKNLEENTITRFTLNKLTLYKLAKSSLALYI